VRHPNQYASPMRPWRALALVGAAWILVVACSAQGVTVTATPPSGSAESDTGTAEPDDGTAGPSNPRRALEPDLTIVAHRGSANGNVSENGLPALLHASNLGADMVEFDVRPTLDRRLVVMHDGGLARTSDCHGQVWARTLADIQADCRLGDGSWVPSFDEYVDLARRQKMPLMIELKAGPGWSPEALEQMRDLLGPMAQRKGSVFLSFDEDLLDLAHDAMPRIPGIWIVPRGLSSSGSRSRAVLNKATGGFLVDGDLTSRAWVRTAHEQGQLVYGRVVDTTMGWQRCRHIGLDGVLSNDLVGFLAWRTLLTE